MTKSKKPPKQRKIPRWLKITLIIMLAVGGIPPVGVLITASLMDDGGEKAVTKSEPEKSNPEWIGGLRVEKGAVIADSLKEEGWRLVKAVQRSGYPCDTISGIWEAMSMIWDIGNPVGLYGVSCNNEAHTYKVEGLGIKGKVTPILQ